MKLDLERHLAAMRTHLGRIQAPRVVLHENPPRKRVAPLPGQQDLFSRLEQRAAQVREQVAELPPTLTLAPRHAIAEEGARDASIIKMQQRIERAAADAIRDVLNGDGSAKIFQPVDRSKIGPVKNELELFHLVFNHALVRRDATEKTEQKPFRLEAHGFLMLAFAGERASLALGDEEAASIWRFVRSIPKDAALTRKGYVQPGGFSRVIEWMRGTSLPENHEVCCFRDQVTFEMTPRDALLFANGFCWPVTYEQEDTESKDQWDLVTEKIRGMRLGPLPWRSAKRRMNGSEINLSAQLGLALPYVQLDARPSDTFFLKPRGARLDGFSVVGPSRWYKIMVDMSDFSGCSMPGSRFENVVVRGSDFTGADLSNSVFDHYHEKSCKFSRSKHRGSLTETSIIEKSLWADADFSECKWVSCEISVYAAGAHFERSKFISTEMTIKDLTEKGRFSGASFISSTINNNEKFVPDLTGASWESFRLPRGWVVQDGLLARE